MKITIIGAGSSYTPELIEGIITRYDSLPVSEIALVDIEAGRSKLEIIEAFSKRMLKRAGISTKISSGTDRRSALEDSAGSNHQICGVQGVFNVIDGLLSEALQISGLDKKQIDYAVLGLAGADMPEDFEMLRKLLQPAFAGIDFDVVNDAWIIMRGGLPRSVGAVCICGTGTNAAAENVRGEKAILRSLDYIIGSYGGGGDIAAEALHYAFRADEKTGDATKLAQELPSLFGVNKLDDMIPMIYPRPSEIALA